MGVIEVAFYSALRRHRDERPHHAVVGVDCCQPVLGLLVLLISVGSITRSLASAHELVERLVSGDFLRNVAPMQPDEVVQLADAIARISGQYSCVQCSGRSRARRQCSCAPGLQFAAHGLQPPFAAISSGFEALYALCRRICSLYCYQ